MKPVQANNVDDQSEEDAGDWVRERDDELPAELWDEQAGQMVRPSTKRPSARAHAEVIVAAALQDAARAKADETPDAQTAEFKESN
jgi:hypothetical protein